MKKMFTKKTDKEEFLSKNHQYAIKYRRRVQNDAETEQELKEFLKENNAGTTIQDDVCGEHFPAEVCPRSK